MTIGELDVIKDTSKEKEVHWEIPNFLSEDIDFFCVAPHFKFLKSIWELRIDPAEDDNKDYLGLRLLTNRMDSSYNMLCTFGIKKRDGSMIGNAFFKHNFSSVEVTLIVHKFFTRSGLLQHKYELMPLNILTIICNIKLVDLIDSPKLTELNTLSKNFKNLLTNGDFSDTTLQVKEKEFKAHKIILATRSPVFAAMFKHETTEKKSGIVKIPDCDPESFPVFLEFLYSGKLENISSNSAIHLYKTADKYDVQELKKFCVEYMKNNLEVSDVCNIILLAEVHDEEDLLAAAQSFFNRNLSDIFDSDGWKDLLKNNFNLVNKLLKQMALKVQVVE